VDKNFDFAKAEQEIYSKWLESNAFRAEIDAKKKPYTIIMPPPNITARLHIGHAFDLTIQDILIRFKRMQGFNALYLPGSDHAAVATEVKVKDELRKQGIDPNKLSHEEFMKHIEAWYVKYKAEIRAQMERLGLSCDWSRYAFTMDTNATEAVKKVFNDLYKKGLIYKGKRMVNICPGCKSALSDAEVEYKEQQRTMYYVNYSHTNFKITVATVRPETIPGDTAICVNPKDKRYAKYVGKTVINPLTNKPIPVIADEYVDMKFGTGALKITPAHDHADYEIGLKYNLPIVVVEDVSMEARKKAIEKLKAMGALVKEEKYTGNVGVCYRCFSVVEPTISNQWFMKMTELAKPAIKALHNGLEIYPKKFEKIYLNWLTNIKDWCISRQIQSGHRIPVDGETDTLDTWFSSALWPFCTLGWASKNKDFDYFYPTQTMVTAYEIIFFWVIRMVFSGIEHTGKIPFERVLFHGLVRDAQGRKMSKSLGNGIDPVKIIDEFGTDVLRFSIIAGTKLDRDPRYSVEKATLARNFINKIWNSVKFYEMICGANCPLRQVDKWILTKTNNLIKSITKKYERFDFGVAANELQSFFWGSFCDWYIEESKQTKNAEVFKYVLETFLKLVHPIMPFVTEHIWTKILGHKESLLTTQFPTSNNKNNYPKDTKEFEAHIVEVTSSRAKQAGENGAQKERTVLEKEIARIEFLFKNPAFIANAPKEVIAREKEKLENAKKRLAVLK